MKIKIQADKKIIQELAAYMKQCGIEEPEIQMEGQECILVANVDEEELYKIKRKYKALKVAYVVESGADKAVRATDETLSFITNKIVAPIVKTGARTAGNLIKATARTITATGSILIETAKDTVEEVKQDKNVQDIKKELSKAKGFLDSFRNRKKKKDDLEIIEE